MISPFPGVVVSSVLAVRLVRFIIIFLAVRLIAQTLQGDSAW